MSEFESGALPSATSSEQILKAYQRVARVTGLITGLAALVSLGLYYYLGAWQILIIASSLVLVLGIHLVAGRLAQSGRPAAAMYSIALSIVVSVTLTGLLTQGGLISAALLFGLVLLGMSSVVSTRGLRNFVVILLLTLAGLVNFALLINLPRLNLPSALPGLSLLDICLAGLLLALLLLRVLRYYRSGGQQTLNRQLMLMLTGVAIVPLVLIIAIIVWPTRATLTTQAGESFLALAQSESQRLGAQLAGEVKTLRNLASDDRVRKRLVNPTEIGMEHMSPEQRFDLLKTHEEAWVNETDQILRGAVFNNSTSDKLSSFVRDLPGHTQLLLTDRYGRLVAAGGAPPDHYYYGDRVWWYKTWNNGQGNIYVGSPSISPDEEQAIIEIAAPVLYESRTLGVLHSRFAIDKLSLFSGAASRLFSLGETGELSVADSTGLLLYSSNPERARTPLLEKIRDDIARNPLNWGVDLDETGKRIIHSHATLIPAPEQAYLATLGWTVIVQQSEAEALAYVNRLTRLTLTSGLLVLALSVAVAGRTAERLTRPIEDLTYTTSAMAGGQLGLKANVSGPMELRTLAQSFNSMTAQLRQTMEGLERQVADRTRDLERRAVQLQAAAEVGQAAASVRNLEELLPQVMQLISERFGFYHAGIFLLDELGKYAVLRAANSEGGQQMLARNYKLRVGEQGIVGYVTSTGEPRIALNVGEDAVHFQNPYLPGTRSEMALPLVAGDRLLGALDVQSTEEAAFTREDIAVLQVLADQVAMAIENARIFEELQTSVRETNTLYQRYSQEAWSQTELGDRPTSYEYDRLQVIPIDRRLPSDVLSRLQAGRVVTLEGDGDSHSRLIVPIMLRGQAIGSIGFEQDDPDHQWTPEELAMVEAVTSQVALAMENARLFEEAQAQARREQIIRQITEQMRRAVDVESILQTTVTKLGQIMGAPRVYVRLGTQAELGPANGSELDYNFPSASPEISNEVPSAADMDEETNGA